MLSIGSGLRIPACRVSFPNPMHSLVLLITLLAGILQLSSFPAQASSPPADQVAQAQTILQSMGFYTGKVDGIMGSRTAAAIRRFQIKQGLKVSGKLNRQTMEHLGLLPKKFSLRTSSPLQIPG